MADFRKIAKRQQDEPEVTGPRLETCDYCRNRYIWPDKTYRVQFGANYIVGRSNRMGYICIACYQRPAEPDLRDSIQPRRLTT